MKDLKLKLQKLKEIKIPKDYKPEKIDIEPETTKQLKKRFKKLF